MSPAWLNSGMKQSPYNNLLALNLVESKVMVMENLKTDGYKLVPKRTGLDMAHIKLLLDQVGALQECFSITHILSFN